MRRVAVVVGGWTAAAAGCLAPFSWPEDRPPPAASAAAPDDDALTRAADRLEHGDEAGAVPHLRAYLRAHPDALMIRAHLAELLLRQGRADEARAEFERFIADAQLADGPPRGHLVHCHTRLMALAEAGGDTYREELHRGIGLLLLVERWDADPGRRDETAAEQTLAKAAAALRAAADERPGDPRAHLYLADVYARLGQPSAARAALRAARAGLPDPAVTPAERERIAELTTGREMCR
jgi:thioredoxin-like negative regulator of GroEL